MSRDDLLHDLTLVMLYLTSWEEKGPAGLVRRAWKSYDWDAIDRLDSERLIGTSHRAKSAHLSDEACRRARRSWRGWMVRGATAKKVARRAFFSPRGLRV